MSSRRSPRPTVDPDTAQNGNRINNDEYPSPGQIRKVLRKMVTSCGSRFPIGTTFIAHYVCCGTQHDKKPLESALLLRDRRLLGSLNHVAIQSPCNHIPDCCDKTDMNKPFLIKNIKQRKLKQIRNDLIPTHITPK